MPEHSTSAARREHESIIGTGWTKASNHCIRERHGMVAFHFHPLAGHNPHAVCKIELAPSSVQRFLVCFSTEVAPSPNRPYRIDVAGNFSLEVGPNRRRSGPHPWQDFLRKFNSVWRNLRGPNSVLIHSRVCTVRNHASPIRLATLVAFTTGLWISGTELIVAAIRHGELPRELSDAGQSGTLLRAGHRRQS
jgi:hypothetical protein